MKENTTWNIYEFSQKGIETGYLQCYPLTDHNTREVTVVEKDQDSIKNGQIERAIHGGMHAGRVSLLVLVLYYLFRQCFPEYAKESLSVLSMALNIDQDRFIDLMRAAAIYHDWAREDEGMDRWDEQSAEKLHEALKQLECSQEICDLFQSAVANKDNTKNFITHCQSRWPEISPVQADYLRKIINLADCFDIIRCQSEFNFSHVIQQLVNIPGYDEKVHLPFFISLAQNLHTVIWDQGDMLYDCKLVLNDKTIPTERSGAHFIRARKVQFEHAENLVSAMAADMMRYSYFKPMLEGEKLLCTDLATVQPAFDPFIHGTQSGMLAMIKLMRDRKLRPELTSPLALVQNFLAPMTGELSRRGASHKLTDSAMMCFGRLKLQTEDCTQYDYKGVLRYAMDDAKGEIDIAVLKQRTCESFVYYLNECYKDGYSYINALMIYYLRAKQLGIEDEKLLGGVDKEKIVLRYRQTIGIYYLILLLEKHLRLDKELLQKLRYQQSEFARQVAETLNLKVLIERIGERRIDLKAIYENPSKENLSRLLPLFDLPGGSLNHSKPWLVIAFDDPEPCVVERDTIHDFSMFTRNVEGIDLMLLYYIQHYPSSSAVVGIQKHVPEHIQLMEQTLELLTQVFSTECEDLSKDPTARYLITKNFPLMLICEVEDAIDMASFQLQEFRANRPLIFGEDIKLLATDTRRNAAILRKFLNQNGFSEVEITLFDELENVGDMVERPKLVENQEKYPVPSLRWLAQKAVVPGTVQKRIGESLHHIVERRFKEAIAKKELAFKAVNNQEERRQATKEYRKASAEFWRVNKTFEDLEVIEAYHNAFTN